MGFFFLAIGIVLFLISVSLGAYFLRHTRHDPGTLQLRRIEGQLTALNETNRQILEELRQMVSRKNRMVYNIPKG